jgi:hypothetical protein
MRQSLFWIKGNNMLKPFLYIYRFISGRCLTCGDKMEEEILINGTEAFVTKRCLKRHRRIKPVIKRRKYCP